MLERILQIYYFLADWRAGKPLLGGLRSPRWREFRRQHIKKECECCGRSGTLLKPLELHHLEPYHINPARECDPTNVITGCRDCHHLIYHLRDFKSWNINAREDAIRLSEKIKNRP